MATDTDSVHDHMTRLRMKMVQQKIANERDKLNRPGSTDSGNDVDEQVKLQQAMLRRQELLDKIRHEQLVNEDYRRPRSYSARRRYTPSPVQAPPSRRSLPDFNRNRGEQSFRDDNNNPFEGKDMSQVKHVIEHRVAAPNQYHLPPIQQSPQLMNPPPIPSYSQTYPQHIIQQVPQPVFQNLVPEPQQRGMFQKGDWMEMMMMQNHQMHQLVVQQMMLHSLPGGGSRPAPVTYLTEPAARSPPAVHHHHYQVSSPAQPAVHHYSSLPPLEPNGKLTTQPLPKTQPQPQQSARIISPVRAATTSLPGYYYYNDDGSNYYVYH